MLIGSWVFRASSHETHMLENQHKFMEKRVHGSDLNWENSGTSVDICPTWDGWFHLLVGCYRIDNNHKQKTFIFFGALSKIDHGYVYIYTYIYIYICIIYKYIYTHIHTYIYSLVDLLSYLEGTTLYWVKWLAASRTPSVPSWCSFQWDACVKLLLHN